MNNKKKILNLIDKITPKPGNYLINNNYLNIDNDLFFKFNSYLTTMLKSKNNYLYNVLFVCDCKYLLEKMSRVRFWAIENLSKHKDVKLYLTGPGFNNFNSDLSLQQNIMSFKIKFDLVIWYKPLNKNYNFSNKIKMPFKTCLRYNEMWDKEWTAREINQTNTNIIICHHENDYMYYKKLYKNDKNKQFIYIPHHANPSIFKPLNIVKDIDILMSGVANEKHYPFKYRLNNILINNKDTRLKKYKIHIHKHPNYKLSSSFLNVNQIDYNKIINQSKICIVCSSRYNYRLGKYVEIPMAGSVMAGDLPYEDRENFSNFMIVLNNKMSDNEIIDKLIEKLENIDNLNRRRKRGLLWSLDHTTDKYVNKLVSIIK